MLTVTLICVGKMRERFYVEAMGEYQKRLSATCKLDVIELSESAISDNPSHANIESALFIEASEISRRIPKNAITIAMCVEGEMLSSEELALLLRAQADSGSSKICFIIGGSFGLHESIKSASDYKLSMSRMTFPHHLARVILAEQLYRAFSINRNSKYHK